MHLHLRDIVRYSGTSLSATLVHRLGHLVTEQDFTVEVLDDHAIATALSGAGLEVTGILTPDRTWLTARRA